MIRATFALGDPGARRRLLVLSVLMVLLSAAVGGLWLHLGLRPLLEEQSTQRLLEQTREAALALRWRGGEPDAAAVAALSEAVQARVTLIGPDGAVRLDSHVPAADLAGLPSHAGRAELRAALDPAGPGWGAAWRRSETLDQEMLYVAVPFAEGALRLSREAAVVHRLLDELRRLLALVTALGVVASVAMTGVASLLNRSDLARIVEQTRRVAEGGDEAAPGPEPAARSISELSANLRQAVHDLAEERNHLEAVLGGMTEGVLALDPELRVTLVNPALRALFDCPEVEEDARLADLPPLAPLGPLAARAAAEGAASGEIEVGAAAQARLLLARVSRREDDDLLVVVHDISTLRRLETIRRDFVANVSHELRTPVSIVRASAEALQDGALADPGFAAQLIDVIQRNSERMGLLINDLLSLSRIEAGAHRLDTQDVDLRGAVEEVMDVLRVRDGAHQIHDEVPPELWVRADPVSLEQVLVNLLENAMKYTPPGGQITLRARAGDPVRIEVADDGPGVPPEHRARIFERFYRVDKGRSRDVGGTGLGLAIVRHLVEVMHGSVGVEANSPHGSVFWVDLPAAAPERSTAEEEPAGTGEGPAG